MLRGVEGDGCGGPWRYSALVCGSRRDPRDERHACRVADNVLENPVEHARQSRVVQGQTAGFGRFGVGPRTILGAHGLENGNSCALLEGVMWPNRRTAFEAYARLRRADHFTIDLHRQGRCLNVEHVCFVLLLCATIYPIVGPACSLFDPLLAYEPCTLRYGARRVHPPPPPPGEVVQRSHLIYVYTCPGTS